MPLILSQATLASVIMTAVLFSVDHHIVAPMWRASSEYTNKSLHETFRRSIQAVHL